MSLYLMVWAHFLQGNPAPFDEGGKFRFRQLRTIIITYESYQGIS